MERRPGPGRRRCSWRPFTRPCRNSTRRGDDRLTLAVPARGTHVARRREWRYARHTGTSGGTKNVGRGRQSPRPRETLMMRTLLIGLVAAFLAVTAASAHHSFGATYEVSKEIKLDGK